MVANSKVVIILQHTSLSNHQVVPVNLHSAVYQLYLNKAGKRGSFLKKKKKINLNIPSNGADVFKSTMLKSVLPSSLLA